MDERRPGRRYPIPFYERYGFVRPGEVVFDDEVLLRLELTESSGRPVENAP